MTRIITDSTADFTRQEASALGLDIVPLRTRFGAPEEALKGAGIDVKKLMERAGRFFEQRGGALHLKEEFFLVADGIVAKYII